MEENISEEYEKEEIYLVAGLINATGQVLFWKFSGNAEIGDYALVENAEGYDLIRIVAVIATDKQNARYFSNTKYEKMKSVIMKISKDILEK